MKKINNNILFVSSILCTLGMLTIMIFALVSPYETVGDHFMQILILFIGGMTFSTLDRIQRKQNEILELLKSKKEDGKNS
ncbi:MAG: hypothetical protein FWC67_00790 [Defluviitaleaceae bacterium]|nr:hypothetical protein [Defluviitaleaceae bacterium]